jgi:hypothetical protein
VPFFGHALELAKAPPWDVMFDWLQESGERLVRMDFMGKVCCGVALI